MLFKLLYVIFHLSCLRLLVFIYGFKCLLFLYVNCVHYSGWTVCVCVCVCGLLFAQYLQCKWNERAKQSVGTNNGESHKLEKVRINKALHVYYMSLCVREYECVYVSATLYVSMCVCEHMCVSIPISIIWTSDEKKYTICWCVLGPVPQSINLWGKKFNYLYKKNCNFEWTIFQSLTET